MSLADAKLAIRRPTRATVVRYAGTRLATVADQLLVAVANFALTLAIGRAYPPEALASYGIGLSMGLLLQGWHRHAVTIPLMLESDARIGRRCAGIAGQHGIVLAVSLLAGGALLAAVRVGNVPHYATLVVAATVVCLIIYVELEFARALLVKLGRPGTLLLGAGWYAFVVAVLAVTALAHRLEYWMLLAALCTAMLLHAVALLAVMGTYSWRQGWQLLSLSVRKYGGWSAAATATYAGYNHVPLLILGALAAPIHAAAFVATRSLMQPLQILLRGLDIADKSSFDRLAGGAHQRSALRHTFKLAALYACVAALFGVAIGLFAEQIVVLAYGQKFAGLGPVLVAWIPVNILISLTMPFESLVYSSQAFRSFYLLRGLASMLAIGFAVPLVIAHAEIGAIFACAIGWLVTVVGTILLFLRNRRP
jgi:O-antigen/teichoic acid export membrane protein